MLGADDVDKLVDAVADLKTALVDFKGKKSDAQQVIQQYNAGGTALWIVIVMAAIIFTMAITLGPRVSRVESRMDRLEGEQEQKLDRMQDYLNNIYQQAPWLKPSEDKNGNSNHNH